MFVSFYLEKLLHEVCFIRIKVGVNGSTVGSNRNANCPLKIARPSSIANILSINILKN